MPDTTVTVRDKFFEAMAGDWSLTQAETAELYTVIDANLAAHAHELAEKIRQDTTVMGEAGDQYALAYAHVIDPEAQR